MIGITFPTTPLADRCFHLRFLMPSLIDSLYDKILCSKLLVCLILGLQLSTFFFISYHRRLQQSISVSESKLLHAIDHHSSTGHVLHTSAPSQTTLSQSERRSNRYERISESFFWEITQQNTINLDVASAICTRKVRPCKELL